MAPMTPCRILAAGAVLGAFLAAAGCDSAAGLAADAPDIPPSDTLAEPDDASPDEPSGDDDAVADVPGADDGTTADDGTSDEAPADEGPHPPGVGLMHTAAQLEFMRAHRDEVPWQAAYLQVLAEAETGLGRIPEPKEDFDVPFYYADPDAAQAAKEGLRQDASAAYALALGYQLAGTRELRETYAAKAIEILDAWAALNTQVSGADGDLVVIYAGIPLLFAADLVMNGDEWDDARRGAFLTWTTTVFENSAAAIKDRVNNWGDWGTLGVVAARGLVGDTAAVLAEADRIRGRITTTIAADGELPEENKRTNNGMWYTFFALTSMTTAVQIILNTTGLDLYGYEAPNGRSIRLALDKEFFYAVHPDQWPYPLPEGLAGDLWRLLYPCDDTIQMPMANGWPGTLFEVMSDVYGVAEWEDWVSPFRPLRGYHAWIYSTLVRQTP
ncbi:MAG: alginate lyase family protein [Deltaproteobacteria bacterium]|nr:alginate lyase family protein [Deltaproteobacteria bacterium]